MAAGLSVLISSLFQLGNPKEGIYASVEYVNAAKAIKIKHHDGKKIPKLQILGKVLF